MRRNYGIMEACAVARKIRFVAALMIPLLLLGGCGEREARRENSFAEFRASVNGASFVTVRAALTADSGESVEEYVLNASYDGNETTVEIVEPAQQSAAHGIQKLSQSDGFHRYVSFIRAAALSYFPAFRAARDASMMRSHSSP